MCTSTIGRAPRSSAAFLLLSLAALWLALPGLAWAQRVDPLIAVAEDPLELQHLAIQFIRVNQPQDALAALNKALQTVPDNAETHMWVGVALTQLNDLDGAEASFGRALATNPRLTEAHNWFGVYWARRGDLDRAVAEYMLALRDPAFPPISRARVLANLGVVHIERGDLGAAIAVLSEANQTGMATSDPLYSLIRVNLAESLLKSGRGEETLATLRDLVGGQRKHAEAELLTGLAYRDLGEDRRAREHLQEVLRAAPGTAHAQRALDALAALPSVIGQR